MQQFIAADWHDTVLNQIGALGTLRELAQKVPSGDECEQRWDAYTNACTKFVLEIEQDFGSVEGLRDFLKTEAISYARTQGISVGEDFDLEVPVPENSDSGGRAHQITQLILSYHYALIAMDRMVRTAQCARQQPNPKP